MTFAKKLADCAAIVEQRLDHVLNDERQNGTPERLLQAMRHAVLSGGKRVRPFLVLESTHLLGGDEKAALETAAALECLHCYSLVHDDLPAMDNDALRRGQPTVWTAYDEWTAILAGDALQALAFQMVTAPECHQDPEIRSKLALALAKASGGHGMVGGQALDLAAERLATTAANTVENIQHLQAMKTGQLIIFAAEAGAIIANASPEEHAALKTFGNNLGLAFQISDDLLDAEGDAEVVGKAVAKDDAQGKATLVSLLGLEAARERLAAAEAAALVALDIFDEKANTLRDVAKFVVQRRS